MMTSEAASAHVHDELSAPFWKGCEQGQLFVQSCADCNHRQYPPIPLCGKCQSANLLWRVSPGKGTLYSYTIVWRPVDPSFEAPYIVAIAEMDDGWFLLSNLIGTPVEDVAIGSLVEVFFEKRKDGLTLPKLRQPKET